MAQHFSSNTLGLRSPCRFASCLDRGQQQRNQDPNNGNDNELEAIGLAGG
jgi:hypothetical protein